MRDLLSSINSVSAPAVHPSGSWACVSVVHPDPDADAYVGQLWRVDLKGVDAPRRLTRGVRDTAPQFSPDGRFVGFLRSELQGRPQLWIAPADGGEAVRATDAPLGVDEFAFSPNSTRIAFVARVPEPGRYGTDEKVDARHEPPRRIDTLSFQANGVGWVSDRRRHLFVTDTPDPFAEPVLEPTFDARQLTAGDADHVEPCWTPDGRAVWVCAARNADRDTRLVRGIHAVAVDGSGVTTVLEDPTRSFWSPVVSGDGTTLFCLTADMGESGTDFVGRGAAVAALPFGGELRLLTDPTTHDFDYAGLEAGGPHSVLALRDVRGTTELVRVHTDGELEVVWRGLPEVKSVAAIPDRAHKVVAVVADAHSPGEVVTIGTRRQHRLTDFAAKLQAGRPAVVGQELIARAPDDYPVHGWVYVPEGEGPHPVLLCIHGGPHSSYHAAWFDEFQAYCAAGYAVVACNPRGSSGYGQAHARAIKGDMGHLDMVDVLAFLEHALATVPGLDAARVGVQGGSYGGYLTAWITGHDHRFAAAIVERGYLDPATFVGASDIGWFFSREYTGLTRADADRQSPTTYVDQVRTPTLVLHSEEDLRCPLGQALRYYTELKLNGVDAELLVFPGENHELSRSGTPRHRLQRFEAILGWWARYLPTAQNH